MWIGRCANPLCGKLILMRKKKKTLGGKGLYCSKECASEFTPKMIQVALKWRDSEDLDLVESLRNAIKYVCRHLKFDSDKAKALNVDKRTFKKWQILFKTWH
jgi:hypothetical protein